MQNSRHHLSNSPSLLILTILPPARRFNPSPGVVGSHSTEALKLRHATFTACCRSLLQDKYRVEPELLETVCPHCPSLVPKGYPIDLEPLWLHAMAYSGPGWAFEAPPPDWADPEFVPKPRTAAASLPRATLKQLSSAAVVM